MDLTGLSFVELSAVWVYLVSRAQEAVTAVRLVLDHSPDWLRLLIAVMFCMMIVEGLIKVLSK